ncbi:MAG: hypothetical protein AB7V45_09620 [Candidatus Krumholzibacteriia bacterium]
MAETKARLNLSVDPIAHDIVMRTGNASAYLTRVVLDRRKLWTSALHYLENSGWSRTEIRVACYALREFNLDRETEDLAESVRQRIPDDPTQIPGARRLGIKAADWKKRVVALENQMACLMLWIIEREYWMGNSELISLVGESD